MAMNPSVFARREMLKMLGAGTLALAWPGLTAAATGRDTRLIVVILRGGMDGLSAVPAYGEPQFAGLRGPLGEGNLRKLDGTFALHPVMQRSAELYAGGELAVVHAVAPPYHGRSHFEAQDCLENGCGEPHLSQDGWLNRAVGAIPGSEGLAIASAMPMILRGQGAAETWAPSTLPQLSQDMAMRVAKLYARDPRLGPVFERAVQVHAAGMQDERGGPGQRLAAAVGQAARIMGGRDGLRVVALIDGGWDTHARQAAVLDHKLATLDEGLGAAKDQLGAAWSKTLVVVATEFGRTVRINGSAGTDHGTGGVMLLAGGALKGGKIYGDWPGLAPASLLDGRDLKPTTDSRAVFKGLLRDHLGVSEVALEKQVFPDSAAAKPLEGLTRGVVAA